MLLKLATSTESEEPWARSYMPSVLLMKCTWAVPLKKSTVSPN